MQASLHFSQVAKGSRLQRKVVRGFSPQGGPYGLKPRTTLRSRGATALCCAAYRECEKYALAPMPFGYSTPRSGGIECGAPLKSRRDSVLQPRVGRNEPPWATAGMAPNPNGAVSRLRQRPQPRWGCCVATPVPRVARASQPWALIRNPVGIQAANIRKALAPALPSASIRAIRGSRHRLFRAHWET